jgi:hypothetical protein
MSLPMWLPSQKRTDWLTVMSLKSGMMCGVEKLRG